MINLLGFGSVTGTGDDTVVALLLAMMDGLEVGVMGLME